MAVFPIEHKVLTRRLIETITGFRPPEDNYKLCFQFAKSNFRFHRFLDVNDLNVSRAITGLQEKYQVHSQPDRARALEDLTEHFFDCNLENHYSHSDTHYGILLFLLCLADSPVNADYVRRADTPTRAECVDDFDWTRYLMNGIDYHTYSDSDSEWSDSSSQSGETTPTKPSLNDSAVGEEIADEEEPPVVSHSKTILLERVLVPYWDASNPDHQVDLCTLQARCPATSAHSACNLTANWTSYLKTIDPLHTPSHGAVTLTEWQVVRETLWACLGAGQSFVYEIKGSEVNVRKHIQLMHLTPLSLHRQLLHFASLISMLRTIRTCCLQMLSPLSHCNNGDGPTGVPARDGGWVLASCKTYEAFSSALRAILDTLETDIREIERTAIKQAGLVTLMSLEVCLSPIFRTVQELYTIVTAGVVSIHQHDAAPSPVMCSSHLLSTLWSSLVHFDTLGLFGRSSLATVLPLWLASVRPYVELLETWVGGGALRDKWAELCIQRDCNNGGSNDQWNHWSVVDVAVPEVLKPIISEVFQAGKSMYIIEKIGMLKEIDARSGSPATPPSSLYEEYIASLKYELSYSTISHDPPRESHDPSRESHDQLIPATNIHISEGAWHLDPLVSKFVSTLQTNISMERGVLVFVVCISPSPSVELWKQVCCVAKDAVTHSPLHLTLQHSLSSLLRSRCLKASGALVKLLNSQYHLLEHFKTVQRYFLMGDGPVMHQFCYDIFQRINNGDVWQDTLFLNTVLHEALQGQFTNSADMEQRLSVVYTPQPHTATKSIRHSLSSISLHYQVPWPLAVVFPTSIMTTYNQVFHLLLQVNWAKWSLESVHVRQIEMTRLSLEGQRKVRLLLLLRGRLLHFVNNLTNYIMTRILHSVGIEFEQSMSIATDMDSILALHNKYTETIFDRCLLNKKASIVKEAIMNVLGLALEFKGHWDRGIAKFSRANAEKIESEFSKCSHFLITCLNNTVKRGSFPHLETLAFSMRTLKTAQKVFS